MFKRTMHRLKTTTAFFNISIKICGNPINSTYNLVGIQDYTLHYT